MDGVPRRSTKKYEKEFKANDVSIQSVMENAPMLLDCLANMADNINDREIGEVNSVIKIAVSYCIILNSPTYNNEQSGSDGTI